MAALIRSGRSVGGSAARRRISSAAAASEARDRSPASVGREGAAEIGVPARRGVRWVFLGCPGVGKGTYASRLSQLLGVPHVAMGDLVRDELASPAPLAKELAGIVNQGKLVPDEIIVNLLSEHLKNGEAKGESGFILDGFPRTIRQAEILEGVADIDLVINLKLREEALLMKCLGRRICRECGGNFNVASVDIKDGDGSPHIYMPQILPPEQCLSKLVIRKDDADEKVVKTRLRIYFDVTQPVEEFYRSRGKLLEFALRGGIPESWRKLLEALNLKDPANRQSAAL